MLDAAQSTPPTVSLNASRTHHSSWVIKDQERTRAFYEELIGLPLKAFWIETVPWEGKQMVLSHAFYGLQDGSALTFFHIPDPAMAEKYKSPTTEMFNHFALKIEADALTALEQRLKDTGTFYFIIDHGYCNSLYTIDPDGLRLEFAVDTPKVDAVIAEQDATAHQTMKEWIAGRRETNNHWRTEAANH